MNRSAVRVVLAAGLLLCTSQASWGITTPVAGAVSLPAGFDIRLPFTAGETCYVSSGYGPNAGSSLHSGTNNASSANDYYALDFIMPQHPNNGLGQPVRAVAAGTVVKAGWATAGWANYGLRVIIQHDYNADGHTYISLYAHLNALYVGEGAHVNQGDHIGDLGDSCEGDIQNLSCPFFGAHLHWAMHRDSTIGGSGTGGSYGGNAVVPEFFDGYEDIVQGQTLTSSNNGQPPQPCQTIDPVETILEDDGPCFQRFGPSQYWHDEGSGHGGHSVWTYTIDQASPDNWARWNLHFAQAGDYDVWAYVPAAFGESQQAHYTVRHNGSEQVVTVDQTTTPNDWLSLGTFSFAAGGDQWVSLADNTGEPYTDVNGTTIAFDALKIAPSGACVCSASDAPQTQACARCGTQTRTCDGCQWPAWSTVACESQGECESGATDEDPTGCGDGTSRQRVCSTTCAWDAWSECAVLPDGGLPGTDASVGVDAGEDDGDVNSGCDCSQSSPAGHGLWLLLVVLWLGLRRRRRQ
ncbi:MAG: peptidoglycan DD-metalloendopeptidase family protein [bacterium]